MGPEQLIGYVEEKTGGAFRIRIHYNESIDRIASALDSMPNGEVEAALVCTSMFPEKLKVLSALDLPFLPIRNLDVQEKVHESYFQFDAVKSALEKNGFTAFYSNSYPPEGIFGTGAEPTNLGAFQGRSVGTSSAIVSFENDVLAKLGAKWVPSDSGNIANAYNALKLGSADMVATTLPAAADADLYKISTWYAPYFPLKGVTCPMVISDAAYNNLSPQYQQVLGDAKDAAYKTMNEEYRKRP